MKKFILTLVSTAILCSACIKTEEKVVINADNTAVVTTTVLVDQTELEQKEVNPFARLIAKTKNVTPDFKTEAIGKKGYTGVRLTYNIKDVTNDKLSQVKSLHSNHENGAFLKQRKGFFSDRYEIDAEYDFERTVRNESADMGKAIDRNDMTHLFTSQFVLQLPVNASSHNAGKADPETSTYIWEIHPNITTSIKAEYEVVHTKNIIKFSIFSIILAAFLLFKFLSIFKADENTAKKNNTF